MSAGRSRFISTVLRATLSCGCTFDFRLEGLFEQGEYVGCEKHSPVIGYDPDDGDTIHDRDQRVVSVAALNPKETR